MAPFTEPEKSELEMENIKIDQIDADVKPINNGEKGMVLSFKNVTYTVPNRQNKKETLSLLDNVSGVFLPNQMAALMGPSGSGKTTLLDVLAGRKTTGSISGTIQFAGRKANGNFLKKYTGYVEQFDTLLDVLTVRDMLLYTAELKRPVSESRAEKEKAVDELIEQLALTRCAKVKIGNALNRGISGGQAKRVNIGIALISNPRVLFLDEPTSGLDSYTANEVMDVVKKLTQNGVTVCATIHSPSQFTFDLFDRLLMLVRGRVVYYGSNSEEVINFMKSFNPDTSLGCGSETGNTAEWITDVIVSTDRAHKGDELADYYEKSEVAKAAQKELLAFGKTASSIPDHIMGQLNSKKATVVPTWKALFTLFWFRTSINYRSAEFIMPRLADKVLVGFIIATLYWQIGGKLEEDSVFDLLSALFMWVSIPAFGAAAYSPSLVLERPTFLRERNDGLYRPVTYLVFKFVEELIIAVGVSLLVSVPVYFAVGFVGNFAIFWLGYFVTLSIGIAMAYFFASISPNIDVVNAALPGYTVTLLFFAGLFVSPSNIPKYWQWYGHIDFLRYTWQSITRSELEASRDHHKDNVQLANTLLERYELNDSDIGRNYGITAAFFIAFFGLALLALTFKRYSTR